MVHECTPGPLQVSCCPINLEIIKNKNYIRLMTLDAKIYETCMIRFSPP